MNQPTGSCESPPPCLSWFVRDELQSHTLNWLVLPLAAVIKDWDEIVDTDETPVPFNAAKVDQMLRQPWARVAVWTAYHESMAGGAHLGN